MAVSLDVDKVLLAVATTHMKDSYECVMCWCETEKKLLRPVTNLKDKSWDLGTFTVGNRYKFNVVELPPVEKAILPHQNEDMIVGNEVIPMAKDRKPLAQNELYAKLRDYGKLFVTDIFGNDNIKEDKYINKGVNCASAGILHCNTDYIRFYYDDRRRKLRCVIKVEGKQDLDFPCSAQYIPDKSDIEKSVNRECLVLLGLARGFHRDGDREHHKKKRCYILVIGVLMESPVSEVLKSESLSRNLESRKTELLASGTH
mgnify:CR=1 FL=1